MAPGISDITLTQLSAFIAAHMGLHFPRERWRDLEREISSAARGGMQPRWHFWRASMPINQNHVNKLLARTNRNMLRKGEDGSLYVKD